MTKKNHVGVTDPVEVSAAAGGGANGAGYSGNGTRAWTSLSQAPHKQTVDLSSTSNMFNTANGERDNGVNERNSQVQQSSNHKYSTQGQHTLSKRAPVQHPQQNGLHELKTLPKVPMSSVRQQESRSTVSRTDPGLVSYV